MILAGKMRNQGDQSDCSGDPRRTLHQSVFASPDINIGKKHQHCEASQRHCGQAQSQGQGVQEFHCKDMGPVFLFSSHGRVVSGRSLSP